MEKSKNINLFLLDGSVTGRIKCSLLNWTGIAYKIPRKDLDKCKDIKYLKQSGVYFLFGKSDRDNKDIVYIGQAGSRKNGSGILRRLQEHTRSQSKDYWSEAGVLTTSNDSFGPTDISYLENRFTTLAVKTNRYKLDNNNDPNSGNVTEEKESDLEEFIDYSKIVMGVLGHKIFISLSESSDGTYTDEADNPNFYIKSAKCNASGKRISNGFIVFKGSIVSPTSTNSCPTWIKTLREQLKNKLDNEYKTNEDIIFSSPSGAAAFIYFGSANGLDRWVTKSGQSLKEFEKSKL